jgi:hypothetical protein
MRKPILAPGVYRQTRPLLDFAAAAGVSPLGLRPHFVTPAAASSHPDRRAILTLIVARQRSAFLASDWPPIQKIGNPLMMI